MHQHVAQAALRDPMDAGRNRLSSPQLGRDHDLPLVLRLDRQEPGACDVGVQKREVGVPGEHRREHPPPLLAVGHEVHVRARHEFHAAASRMDVDHDIGRGKEHGGKIVRDLTGHGPLGQAGERTIEVHAIERREPGGRLRGGHVERRHDDQPSGDLLRSDLAGQPHERHLALVFVTMVAAEAEHRRPGATCDDRDRHHHVGPPTEIV